MGGHFVASRKNNNPSKGVGIAMTIAMTHLSSTTSMQISEWCGLLLGLNSIHYGLSHLCPCYYHHAKWSYGFSHVFTDFFGFGEKTPGTHLHRRAFQGVVGMTHLFGGIALVLATLGTLSGKLSFRYFDYANMVVACVSV